MPITDLSYDDMVKEAQFNTCSCGANLTVAWINGEYVIRCCENLNHGMLKRKERYPEYLREEIGKSMTMELAKISKAGMLRRIDSVRWPKDLTAAQREILADTALEMGLDPREGELMIYQGNLYVGINGRLRKAQDTGNFDGMHHRPGTKEEKAARQLEQGDYLSFVEVWVKGSTHSFEGWGTVHQWEIDKAIEQCKANGNDSSSLPIVKNPQDVADKRGKAVALKEAFHLPLPSIEDTPGGGPEISRKYDVESTGRVLDGNEQTDPDSCPVHHKAFKVGKYGPYCPTKVGDKWCKEKPVEKPAAKVEPTVSQTTEEEPPLEDIFPESEGTTEAPPQVGSDVWILLKMCTLNISDNGILDHINKTYHIPIEPLPVSNTLVKLAEADRNHLTELILAKEKQAGKK